MIKTNHRCPDCGQAWLLKLALLHTRKKPITCPACARQYHFNPVSWGRMTWPLVIGCGLFLAGLAVTALFPYKGWSVALYGLGLIYFVITAVCWFRNFTQKLEFVPADSPEAKKL